jgi:hypothetical protein
MTICFMHIACCGPGSVVAIATGYGLDSTGIEFLWGQYFPHLSRSALGPPPPVQWVPGLSLGKGGPGRDADPTPPPSAVVNERVELYLYPP